MGSRHGASRPAGPASRASRARQVPQRVRCARARCARGAGGLCAGARTPRSARTPPRVSSPRPECRHRARARRAARQGGRRSPTHSDRDRGGGRARAPGALHRATPARYRGAARPARAGRRAVRASPAVPRRLEDSQERAQFIDRSGGPRRRSSAWRNARWAAHWRAGRASIAVTRLSSSSSVK